MTSTGLSDDAPPRHLPPQYPSDDPDERVRYLAGFAILAPSTHNAQPWQFALAHDHIEVWADPSRFLPRLDRDGRQLYMSCGAALLNLRVAMRALGHKDVVHYFPDPARPDLLAVISPGAAAHATARDLELFDAIGRRRTNREPFLPRPIGEGLASEIGLEAVLEGAWLMRLHPFSKLEVAGAIAQADRIHYSDEAYREELAKWLVPRGAHRRDGIPMAKKDVASTLPGVGPYAVRHFDRGELIAEHEAALAIHAPMLAVLGTDADDRAAWLTAGEALEAVFLRATSRGVAMSFLNQVVEEPDLRAAIARETKREGFPQLILRFGYGPDQAPTPRRPLADVLR